MSHIALLSSSFVKQLTPALGPQSVDYENALTNLRTDKILFVCS